MDKDQFNKIWHHLENSVENIKCVVSTSAISGNGEIYDAHAEDHTFSIRMDGGENVNVHMYGVEARGLKILEVEAVGMGNNQQEIAEWVMDQVDGKVFASKDCFNEGEWIHRACKALNWASVPQVGGLVVVWDQPESVNMGG